MLKRNIAVLLGMVIVAAPLVLGHPGKTHVMGVVTALDVDHVVVKTMDGKTVSILLTKATKYLKGEAAAPMTDLKVGVRVVMEVTGQGAKATASEIRLGASDADHDKATKPGAKKF
jgi:hypothetical protein